MPSAIETLTLVAETDAHEGPVYVAAEHTLYFTTTRKGERVDVQRLDLDTGEVTTVRADAAAANGMTLDGDGRLVVCEQGTRTRTARIARLDPVSGAEETVVRGWHGLPLNSPNDVVVHSDGAVWFTDPAYGHIQGFRPEPLLGDDVYRFDAESGSLDKVASGFDKPNGLAFSPDEQTLYVGDSEACVVKAFDVLAGTLLAHERVFAVITDGYPDGLKVDAEGRVYTTCAAGVRIFEPDGAPVGEIPVPGAVNFAFGGPNHDVLFITADQAIWAAQLDTPGA